jgi:hypothetical protein
MKLTDFSELESRVSEIIRRSPLNSRALGVKIEAEDDIEGGEFLRVIVKLRGSQRLNYRKVAPVLDEIRDTVAEADERFPSVRFQEAA